MSGLLFLSVSVGAKAEGFVKGLMIVSVISALTHDLDLLLHKYSPPI